MNNDVRPRRSIPSVIYSSHTTVSIDGSTISSPLRTATSAEDMHDLTDVPASIQSARNSRILLKLLYIV